jgi:hypothetical protein
MKIPPIFGNLNETFKNILFGKWIIDYLSPPLSNGELPDFIKEKEKEEIKNDVPGLIYNTTYNNNNIFYKTSTNFYKTNVTNIIAPASNIPLMPKRLFPEIVAQATPTDPNNKPILSLKESFATKKFGQLLYSPIQDKEETIKIVNAEAFKKKYNDEIKIASEDHKKWLEIAIFDNPKKRDNLANISWDKSCALVNDYNNVLNIQAGIKPLSYIKNYYKFSNKSLNNFPITGGIAKTYKISKYEVKITDFKVSNTELEVIGPNILNGKLGTFLLPFEVPSVLLNILSDNPTVENGELAEIPHLMALFKWFILNFDMLIGEFPLKLEIENKDPLNDENKESVKITIPNLAESIGELYGLASLNAQNSNIVLTLILNLLPEILGTKTCAVVNQDFLKAIASYLGFKLNTRKVDFKSNFSLDNPKSWDDVITPGKDVWVQGVKNDSVETINDYLQRLMYVASLQKEALLTKNKDIGNNELIKKLLDNDISKNINLNSNPDDPNLSDNDRKWLEFLLHINKKDSSFNKKGDKDIPFKPEVDKHNKL